MAIHIMEEAHTPEHDKEVHIATILKNRVPEVSVIFWIIKVLSTTTGETFSDFMNNTVGLGLPKTTYLMLGLLILSLIGQFLTPRYNAFVYWTVVVLVSICGTCITDNLTDTLGIPLWITTLIFAGCLLLWFGAWYYEEGTLDFKTIFTRRREAFYWMAILLTFALGTASGDLISEALNSYLIATCVFAGAIAAVYILYKFVHVNGVFCFWVVYILTRPLGASIGDLICGDKDSGGLGAGYTIPSIVFLVLIIIMTTYLYISVRKERREVEAKLEENEEGKGTVAQQTSHAAESDLELEEP